MLDDLLEAIQQPEITALDIVVAAEVARKYLDPRYKNLLFAEKEQPANQQVTPIAAAPTEVGNGK